MPEKNKNIYFGGLDWEEFKLANIFVLLWQIHLFGFWQIIILKLEEVLLQNIIQEEFVVYKRLFLRYSEFQVILL